MKKVLLTELCWIDYAHAQMPLFFQNYFIYLFADDDEAGDSNEQQQQLRSQSIFNTTLHDYMCNDN